ncbi:MAG: ABC transporter permease [Chloroflexi bacterium]|nr:ABC transporter permease [Chloroflexota bacterium]
MQRDLRGIYTIWYRDVLRFVRDRVRIVASLAQPALYLFVFGAGLAPAISAGLGGGQIDFTQFVFPGILAMAVLFTSIFSAISIVWDREFGFLKEVMVAPVSRTAVALGKVAGGSTVAVFQGSLVLIFAPVLGISLSVGQILLIIALMLLLAAMMTALGILVAVRQRTLEGFQVLMNFLVLPMFFLSGAFFPLNSAPTWLRTLSRLDPMAYGVDALRQVVLGQNVSEAALQELRVFPIGFDVAIMAGLTVLFLTPAVWLFSRQD